MHISRVVRGHIVWGPPIAAERENIRESAFQWELLIRRDHRQRHCLQKLSADVMGNASDIERMMHDRHFEEQCGVLSYTWKCLKDAGEKGNKNEHGDVKMARCHKMMMPYYDSRGGEIPPAALRGTRVIKHWGW
jgi:hypothetical protein